MADFMASLSDVYGIRT